MKTTRREFGGIAIGTLSATATAAQGIGDTLGASIKRHNIPAAVGMVATSDKITYSGAFGKRDSVSDVDVTSQSIFRIASMTKAITSVAAMQLVERGALTLDEPVAKHLPQLSRMEVLDGFDKSTGKAVLHPAAKPITLRLLLTHTAGFGYDTWDGNLLRYVEQAAASSGSGPAPIPPLMTQPGTRWEYGTNVDWTGRLVEAVSGNTLEEYFQHNILQPLGMDDTSFIIAEKKFYRLVGSYQRQSDGSLKEILRTMPSPPKSFNGGGGLYSTAGDYVRFMQMILRRGGGETQPILRPETVASMSTNQIGALSAGKMKSVRPDRSSDVDFHPGFKDGFGFGFLINSMAYRGGRSAGSLAWAGLENMFYWIDPHRGICAVLLMQFLPFCDVQAMGVLREFERAVYLA